MEMVDMLGLDPSARKGRASSSLVWDTSRRSIIRSNMLDCQSRTYGFEPRRWRHDFVLEYTHGLQAKVQF